jgi:hypothetical protein
MKKVEDWIGWIERLCGSGRKKWVVVGCLQKLSDLSELSLT